MQNRLNFFLNKNSLSNAFQYFGSKPDAAKIKEVAGLREMGQELMRKEYPHILERRFDGIMAYVLRGKPPEALVKDGGIVSKGELWVSNKGTGNNTGAICFSSLSDVPLLFERGAKGASGRREIYLYAFLLKGHFYLPGGPWRQIFSPLALELPEVWFGREVLGFNKNKAILGPVVGQAENLDRLPTCESFKKFIDGNLLRPELSSYGTEDTHDEYEIIDTPQSLELQNEVEEFYRNQRTRGFSKK